MKLGFALLLLTCALLFPQPKAKISPLAACINDCSISHAACSKAAKNDADRTACDKALDKCSSVCNKASK